MVVLTRRQAPRDEPGRRQSTFHLPNARRRRPRWQQLLVLGLLVAGGAVLLERDPMALRPTIGLLLGRDAGRETLVRDRPAEEAVLDRRRQGLGALLRASAQGTVVARGGDRVLLVVDQSLVAALLATQFPREYVIEDTYRIWVTGATITFQDGLALVRLDGRASLVGADEDVYADVAVFGDLEVLREQPQAAVLRTRINLIAVDARRVEVVGRRRQADQLVERIGEARLSIFAALASGVEIPVRHEHAIELPAVTEGPVRIEAASLPVRLAVADVKAFRGRLWISMAASLDAPPALAGPLAPLPHPLPPPSEPPAERIARLTREVDALRAQFESAVAEDPLVARGSTAEGHLIASIPPELFAQIVRRIAAVYLDRVAIELGGIAIDKSGEIHRRTFLGRIKAGNWTAEIEFPRIRGVLRAGEPVVRLPGDNRVLVGLPIHLERGAGAARIHFQWDSRMLVNLVCRDFEVTEEVQGHIAPRAYPVAGEFALTAGPGELVAAARFDDRFRIHPELDAVSWAVVDRALRQQDTMGRCGVGLDPAATLAELKALVAAGFVVRLPNKLFRPVSLPARLSPTVTVQGRDVEIELTQSRLEAGPDGVWYGLWVRAGVPRRGAGPWGPSGRRTARASWPASANPAP
jgi:hypothetical protein